MIVAYHCIFTTYGFWLPNDPRGSYSDHVGARELFCIGGKATTTNTRRSVAHSPHNQALRAQAKDVLTYPPVRFGGLQARAVGRGFAEAAAKSNYIIYACAILPEHVHIVIARPRWPIERVVGHLKRSATLALVHENLHPLAAHQTTRGKPPSPWAEGGWSVYLDPDDIQRAIRYVEQNPIKEGKPPQRWSFVKPFSHNARQQNAAG